MKISREPIRFLSSEEMETIHRNALSILAEIGMKIDHDQALDILANVSCQVDRGSRVVKFPQKLGPRQTSIVNTHGQARGTLPFGLLEKGAIHVTQVTATSCDFHRQAAGKVSKPS